MTEGAGVVIVDAMFAGHFDFAVPLFGVVDDVLDEDECAALRARVDGADLVKATVNTAAGRAVREQLRNNKLALLGDDARLSTVWQRLRPHLPPSIAGRQLRGLTRGVRVYRYDVGDKFGLHRDQAYDDVDGARTALTLLVYLNDGFGGGETALHEPELHVVTPRRGRALWFQHMLLHEGRPVVSGVKDVLRSDVVYA
jgi:predicted 2-oxoglutarate/Fe(II)-dependent dioxygenase YbiX